MSPSFAALKAGDAAPDFSTDAALAGAAVVGISNDDIDTQKKFSIEACRNKFSILTNSGGQITRKYDAVLAVRPDLSDRISYVIAPDGKVLYAFSSLDPDKHVENTLRAVEQWKVAQRK